MSAALRLVTRQQSERLPFQDCWTSGFYLQQPDEWKRTDDVVALPRRFVLESERLAIPYKGGREMRFRRISRTMWLASVTLAATLCPAQMPTEQPKEYIDSEGYAVLSTVVAERSRHDCGALTLLVDETRPVKDIVSRISFQNPEHQREWRVLAAEYDSVNRVGFKLLPRFSPPGRYTLLPQAILAGGDGYLRVSAVAFNEKKTLAVVSVETLCGCGDSNVTLLEKHEGKWHEVKWPGKHIDVATCP